MSFETMMQENSKRYNEIKHLQNAYKWSKSPGYAHFTYTAIALTEEAEQLSARDVALLADHGNLCFGGRDFSRYVRDGKVKYSGTVHTD